MGFLDLLAAATDGALTLVGVVLQTLLLTHAARRVLGVPVGWLRTFLVSLVVLTVFAELARWALTSGVLQIPETPTASTYAVVALLAVAALWAFASSAAILVGLEVLWPTGSLPRARDLVFGWGDRLRRTRRYLEVTAIAARHGLGSQLRGLTTTDRPGETARALRATLQDAGVTFVKLGQLTAQAMGPRDFGKIWSIAGSAYTLGLAVGAPIWGLFYDPVEQSYTTGFYLAPVVLAVVVALAVLGMNAGRRQHQAMHAQELAEWEAAAPAVA